MPFLIIGIIAIAYGLIVRAVGSGTLFFLVWIVIGIASIGVGIGIRHHWFSLLPDWVCHVTKLLIVLAAVVFIAIEGLILTGFHSNISNEPDYLIVLGAQIYDHGPSIVLKYRLDTAAEYLSEHPDVVCIVSGGKGYNEPYTEAEGMAKYLTEKGIDKSRIMLEDKSTNTVENIRFSKEIADLDRKRVAIVTNNFHMFRALHIAKKQGLEGVQGLSAGSNPFYLPNNMLREFFGVVKDYIKN